MTALPNKTTVWLSKDIDKIPETLSQPAKSNGSPLGFDYLLNQSRKPPFNILLAQIIDDLDALLSDPANPDSRSTRS
jgi:hypothetical protein